MAAKIAIQNLTKRFRNNSGGYTQALADINVEIADGEFFVIVGPSGCGKSTLLRIMADLDTYTSGSIEIGHTDPGRPLTSMVFQEHALYPWMTVMQNAEFGLDMAGMPKEQRRTLVRPFLEKVGLGKFENYFPHQLSGGMRQRVSLVRAFVSNPEVLLMDEPFAALDAQNKILLQNELMRIWDENRKSVVFITHSIDEALLLGDRIAVMTASPGRIKEIIDVPFPRPRTLFDIQGTPEYTRISRHIWSTMEAEVLNAQQLGAAHAAG
ncbi:MAG TPA: ABC transporter ATP-binding protein [Pseudolabrys sp.]|nr:ABC transporter ATP-binding protein [Pseudolabrys sp.]